MLDYLNKFSTLSYKINERELERKLGLPVIGFDSGSGINLKDPVDEWIHMDIDDAPGIDIVGDIFKGIPLQDGVIDRFHSSEFLEHIPLWNLDFVLREWNRISKIGCKFHITTPNLEYVIKAFYLGLKDEEWCMRSLYGDRGNHYAHQHFTLYTQKTLTELLSKYGFINTRFDNAWGAQKPDEYEWLSCRFEKEKNI